MSVSGPFFRQTADIRVEAAVQRIEREVAQVADARVEILHRAFFRKPTPYYWFQVHAKPRADYWVVTDGGVIYGPWLEGTGSRNQTTRFKGYRAFRTVTQSMGPSVPRIVEPVMTDLVRELNG